MTHVDRGFGVEIECYLPAGRTMQEAAAAVAARTGAPCHVEAYNHQLRNAWKVVTDGSLGDYARGAEFVSPVLHGEAGLEQLVKVCEALQDFGCTVNKSCGLHVHVGVANAPLAFFKTLTKLYSTFEPVIDAMMPISRRGSANGYCRSVTNAPADRIDGAASLEMVIAAVCGGDHYGARYRKLNLSAYHRHKTVEFRQHSGTLDARKAKAWAKLCLRMVDAAMRGVDLTGGAQRPVNRGRPGTKAHAIGEMLLRPQGATRTEIITAMGWVACSVPRQARIAGIAVTAQRVGREVRYHVRTESTALAITIEGFCAKIGADQEERAYIETRTRNLSGPVQWAA